MRLCLVNLMIRETTACQLLGVLCNQCNWLWSASCRPIYVPFQEEMGNASSGGASAPQSPTIRICLRTSKRSNGCPCFLSEHTSTWEAITQNEKFRPYVLRHLLDEGLICSVLESGERQHSLVACEGVLYYEYMEESQRSILREKLAAWQRAAGAGITADQGLSSESAFGELQLARPRRAYGYLPTMQRRLAVLRELGTAIAEEHRSRSRPFHMRRRSPPSSSGGKEEGDVRLALMMNTVALQSLSTLASLATILEALPSSGGNSLDLIQPPFAMLADMLEGFPAQDLFQYWSPLPSDPEKRVPLDPDTAAASCSSALARLAVTGGPHVGWKSSTSKLGDKVISWQIGLLEPATDLTSVMVQWGAGDPTTGTDQVVLPLEVIIEASLDGGKEWCSIVGGDGVVDVAHTRKLSPGSSQHRYPVSLLALHRKRESQGRDRKTRAPDAALLVTHIRLKIKGKPSNRPSGPLRIHDVAVNVRDPMASPSDVMTVLRQVQRFLLAHRGRGYLQEYILRALLGVCKASCALEFELDLVRVYMDIERSNIPESQDNMKGEMDTSAAQVILHGEGSRCSEGGEGSADFGRGQGLQALISTLLSAARRAKRLARRQEWERVVIADAAFDPALSSKWVVISESGQLVSSAADTDHSHSLLHQCLRRGTWSWELALEQESSGDETTCVGVAVNPVTNSCYENSHQMWMVRCYSGQTYSNGGPRSHTTCKIHPLDSVRLTLDCDAGTLSLEVNGVGQGIVFSNVPREVHPAVCFYGIAKSVRVVELKRIYGDSDSDASDSEGESGEEEEKKFPSHVSEITPPSLVDHAAIPSKQVHTCVDQGESSVGSGEACLDHERVEPSSCGKERRRKLARCENQAIASTIRAATVDSPSTGILASLANFAQWYVPRDRESAEDYAFEHDANAKATADAARTDRMFPRATGKSLPVVSDDVLGAASGQKAFVVGAERSPRPRESYTATGKRQSSRLHSIMGLPLSAGMSTASAADTRSPHGVHSRAETLNSWPQSRRALGTTQSANNGTAPSTGSKGKGLALEEPYVVQPTSAVFEKLYDLLVRSLKYLHDGTSTKRASRASAVLSLLQIMRANFCRLVDAHVDPAEVGLMVEYGKQQHPPEEIEKGHGQDKRERLLPNIFFCLQGIMLQREGDPMLLQATINTFGSGLPLLMPRVEDRLHLLLGLVWHLQSNGDERSNTRSLSGAAPGLAQIPYERVVLLRDLLKHFACTESVLQLLSLFEEDEEERGAVSDLLTLMLSSMADKACLPITSIPHRVGCDDEGRSRSSSAESDLLSRSLGTRAVPGPRQRVAAHGSSDAGDRLYRRDEDDDTSLPRESPRRWSYWEQLVADGAGGTTLNFTLLDTCQQHLLCMVVNQDSTEGSPLEMLLCQYGQRLLQVCCRVLSADPWLSDGKSNDDGSSWWQLVGVLLPPFLHGLCMCADRSTVAEGMLPSLVRLSQTLSHRISNNSVEAAAASVAEEIMRQTQLTDPEEGLALPPLGWHPIRASFEVDQESKTSFSISPDGKLYSALTSSSTCALVDVGVSQGKAAWEFLLEEDSPSDECSVFGVATKPPYSRCYNSSQSLRMRRAYNGVLYNRGRQLPVTQNMPKIHPGDVVRCEVDMDEGTVRFSVNGEKQDGGFDDVEGEVFPCAGSYRSGVIIRLLKMEIMGGPGLGRGGANDGVGCQSWDPTEISWTPAPCCKVTRGGLVSIDKKATEVKRMNASFSLHLRRIPPSVVRSSDEALPAQARGTVSPASIGAATPMPHDDACGEATGAHCGGPDDEADMAAINSPIKSDACATTVDIADVEAWDWVSVRANRGFRSGDGKHAVELEVTPVGTRRRASASKTGGSEDKSSLRRYPMAFGLCTDKNGALEEAIGQMQGSWGWWTDGSLRAHGQVFVPSTLRGGSTSTEATTQASYGSEFLPLKPFDVITMVTDGREGTLRFLVNGIDAGIAFGPQGSGAVCELVGDKAPYAGDSRVVLFPSCSLTNEKQVVQLRPAGTLGTQLWPLSLDLQKTVASLAGRLCATMVAGAPQDEEEVALEPWLQSPFLSGGVEASEDVKEGCSFHDLDCHSWDKAWNAGHEGRQLFHRSSTMLGGIYGGSVPRTGGLCSEMRAGATQQDCVNNRVQLGSTDGLRVSARIVQCSEISSGLILWPDSPCVRLTATVDGYDVSTQEDTLCVVDASASVTRPGKEMEVYDVADAAESKDAGQNAFVEGDEAHDPQSGHALQLEIPGIFAPTSDTAPSQLCGVVSLRVEVLVGRVVTATGELNFGDTLNTRCPGTGIKRALRLTGGGEIELVLQYCRVPSPPSLAHEGTFRSQMTLPAVAERVASEEKGDSLRPRCDSVETCLEQFLESIACWPSEVGSASSTHAVSSAGQQISGVKSRGGESGDVSEDEKRKSYRAGRPVFTELLEWLGRSHPDPPFLRKALERTGNYSFPAVEAPFLAALLKHGGLISEAFNAVETISRVNEGMEEALRPPDPTRDMAKIWGRIRQLRAYLRTQRQTYRMMAADTVPSEVDGMAQGTKKGDTARDEKNDVESETEETKEPSGSTRGRATRPGHEATPATFADLCLHMGDRAKFLLELSPSTVQSPSAAAEGTSNLMRHLAEELSDLAIQPPAKFQSRLLRWRSEDRGKERWNGVAGILRVQSQLRRSSSMSYSYRPRAKSLGNRPLGKGADTAVPNARSSELHSSVFIEEHQTLNEDGSPGSGGVAQAVSDGGKQCGGDSGFNSGEESDDSGHEALLDNETAASAAIQACTIYVITGGAVAPPRALRKILRSRATRAAMRTFGLEAMAALLRTLAPKGVAEMSTGAPSTIQEALVFLRPSFQGLRVKRGEEGQEVGIMNDERDPRYHYLKGLEGCSTALLAGVQSVFEDLYGLLRTLLDHSLRCAQPGLAHVLMTTWALDFESRDYRFLAHESGILPTLQAMVTLTKTAGMATSVLAELDSNGAGKKVEASGGDVLGMDAPRKRWIPWSLETIREGFVQGSLLARDLARHISTIPVSALPDGFLEEAGLDGSALDILRHHSMASLLHRYSALLRVHLAHEHGNIEKMEAAITLKRKRLEVVARERVAEMLARGVPVLDEREERKAPEVHLTALCSWVTVPMVESVACTFARGIRYAFTPTEEASASASRSANSGNYFEVTVMNPGEKTTIGVGLADPDVFPAIKQMPGWVDHSYGYHGDDGRKFGRGKTDSIWPTWVDGDVIGCGFDPVRGAIWFTRNGKLLGDGFVPVYESNLVPVVGFHSNGESVRVNFGIAPFTYEGPEVVIAPAVLAERELLMQESRHIQTALDSDNSVSVGDKAKAYTAEEKEMNVDERAPRVSEKPFIPTARSGHSAEGMVPTMKVMQRGALSLLRFLVAVSMRQASLAAEARSDESATQRSVEDASSGANDVRHGAREDHVSGATATEHDGRRRARTTVLPIPPTRERSMYGTPFKEMQTYADSLHQDIFDLILRELRLGALSFRHVGGRLRGSVKDDTQERCTWLQLEGDAERRRASGTAKAERSAKPDMQRSYSHGHGHGHGHGRGLPEQGDGDGWNPRLAWEMLGRGREDSTAQDLGLAVLEIGEVEPHMFNQLALLCSMRQYAVTREQLAHPSALRSLLSLLSIGSPRIQRCVLLLLGSVLSGVEPSLVESCLPESWNGEQHSAASGSFQLSMKAGSAKDQEAGAAARSPQSSNGLVAVLFWAVRQAYSPPVSELGSAMPDRGDTVHGQTPQRARGDGSEWESAKGLSHGHATSMLTPGCDGGFGGGTLDLCLAEQCSSLIRKLYKEPAWKELIARKLLLAIRAAASTVRACATRSDTRSDTAGLMGLSVRDQSTMFDAVAALAIVAGSSGVLYPGAMVRSKSGALGTVVLFSAGDAEAGVVFDGGNIETCEKVLTRDLEATDIGFRTDPDTPAQPIVAQLLSLLDALLQSNNVSHALKAAGAESPDFNAAAMVWSRLLSQTLMAVLQLSAHCSDAVMAACQQGNGLANVLPALLRVAIRPVQVPALITAQEFTVRWRAGQVRMLSALRLGSSGVRTLQPILRRELPPPEPFNVKEESGAKAVASKVQHLQSPSDFRGGLSAEESREAALVRQQRHAEYADPISEATRSARTGGRGRLPTLGDAHRNWGRGWGSALTGRLAVGARGSLDWMGRTTREDDPRRDGGRRRLVRSDLSHRSSTRGRRAASAESRLDPRRPSARTFHGHDRLGDFVECRDEDSGALLVEFNDGTDETGLEAMGVEAGSAGSADSGDLSQDGDEELDINASCASGRSVNGGVDQSVDTEHGSPPGSPRLSHFVRDDRKQPSSVHGLDCEGARETRMKPPSSAFPLSHVLEFDTDARAERTALSARLATDLDVPATSALVALEAIGQDSVRSHPWLRQVLASKEAPSDAPRIDAHASTPRGGGGSKDFNSTEKGTQRAADSAVVSSLSRISDAEHPEGGGEAAGVPSAEEGFNLWEPSQDDRETRAAKNMTPMQCGNPVCEHDLVPVMGLPRTPTGSGGATSTVTTSFLIREVDVLAPGSLLTVSGGEGYAPDASSQHVTVASEMGRPVTCGGSDADGNVGLPRAAASETTCDTNGGLEEEKNLSSNLPPQSINGPCAEFSTRDVAMDEEEVLVDMMDAETGLCLGKRVQVGDLRHSPSFFGRKLDPAGTTVQQLLLESDTALSVLRGRSLLVHLIHSLPTPAIAAAGGPGGLLNITRLLAAHDLANGIAPTSVGTLAEMTDGDDRNDSEPPPRPSVVGAAEGEADHLPGTDSKLLDFPQLQRKSLLKVLWRKVMESSKQWASEEAKGSDIPVLGEMLAQEVLKSFRTLTTTSDTRLSGDTVREQVRAPQPTRGGWSADGKNDATDKGVTLSVNPETSSDVSGSKTGSYRGLESIVHESLHPVCSPLSYGGHIVVDPTCHGMVVKLDSRSRTSSELLRLQFFSSKIDMLLERNPIRVMYGHSADRARAKGLEFFKIEEADNSYALGSSVSNLHESSSVSALDRLALPPALVRQNSTSTTASLGSPTPLAQVGSTRRPLLASRAMTRGVSDAHGQMLAKGKDHLKKGRTPMTGVQSFRSFVLPGVKELWFRFDAPPGAEKTPLQITSLAGALDLTYPATVQASAAPNTERDTGQDAETRSDHEEDASQEELGLQALFTDFSEEQADDSFASVETVAKAPRSLQSDERSKSSDGIDPAMQALPGCLATTPAVLLTTGRWFFEATIECLVGGASEDGMDDCLVRVGWAHAELAPSDLPLGSSTVGEGALARETATIRADHATWPRAAVEAPQVIERVQSHSVAALRSREGAEQPGPLLRTVSWLSESMDSCSLVEEEKVGGDSVDVGRRVSDLSRTSSGEDTSPPVAAEGNEGTSKSVTFPVLGSDATKLGFGIGEEGSVWLGGRAKLRATSGFAESDVIGCALDIDSGHAWFSVNGRWVAGANDKDNPACVMKSFGWGSNTVTAESGIRPCFSVLGKSSVTVNFGAAPFRYPPPEQSFLPVVLRHVPSIQGERHALSLLGDGSRVAFAPTAAASSDQSASKASHVVGESIPENWGFRFAVDPLRGIHYKVVRELDLVCCFGGSATSAAEPLSEPQAISIWRPKAPPGWFSVGDVVSQGLSPPAGGVVVRADPTGCLVSKPAKFRMVYQDKATGYLVWRPVARKGQVSLGDFACAKKASKGIMAGAVRCVAAWAVEASPVVQCLWREEKQSGTQAIWSVQNGLGTFFGSQTGGRMGKKEVTQGPQSRAERQKRKKKKKKKKNRGSVGGESSDDEGDRVKLQLGVGEGWALKGVSAWCITNEWCEESDVVAAPLLDSAQPVASESPSALLFPISDSERAERKLGQPSPKIPTEGGGQMIRAGISGEPRPSVSWASWLLSFLLNHPPLRRLAMRRSLFQTLVAYIRSPGAPHRLRVVPLLTLLVRSHAKFEESPPPLDELSGLVAAVLRECDKAISGRGPGSAAWRPGDSPGGLQLDTKWASAGLLLLTDLATATRRAQDSRRGSGVLLEQPGQRNQAALGTAPAGDRPVSDGSGEAASSVVREARAPRLTGGREVVKVCIPPFGTRLGEGPADEDGQGEEGGEEVERSDVSGALLGGRSLRAEDRALLEGDLRNAERPHAEDFAPRGDRQAPTVQLSESQSVDEEEPPSRCLHYLLEILDTLQALRDGWSPPSDLTASPALEACDGKPSFGPQRPLYLDSLLCEAWMDAVGPATVIESQHPFQKGVQSETLHFPGAEEVVVFLDPRSSLREDVASLFLCGAGRMVSRTGEQEDLWNDAISFRGDSVMYRFVAKEDGKAGARGSLVDGPDVNDWGFSFTAVAKGPVWESKRVEGLHNDGMLAEAPGHDVRVRGSLGLLVELDKDKPLPRGCGIEVLGFTAEDVPYHVGEITDSDAYAAMYVKGDKVRILPSVKDALDPEFDAEAKRRSEQSRRDSHGRSTPLKELVSRQKTDGVSCLDRGREGPLLSDGDAIPDADAKLERLPSNTPVLRPWGEATGVEQRWRSANAVNGVGGTDADADADAYAIAGASYVSHAATVEVGDSDADTKESSANDSPVSSSGGGAAWSRYSTLDEVSAAALPILSAMSSESSEAPNHWSALRELAAISTNRGGSMGGGVSREIRAAGGTVSQSVAITDGDKVDRDGKDEESCDAIGEDGRGDRTFTSFSRPRACAGVTDSAEEAPGEWETEVEPSRAWKWAVEVRATAMPRRSRLLLYLEQRSAVACPGPSLEDARAWMEAWTPEMDQCLLELLGAVGTKSKEEATSGRVTDTLNPWCCRLTRSQAKFHQQRLAAVPAASLHVRAALLLRLNDRIERVLPVIDLASKQEDTLGWQLREMNHLILPHVKNAVLDSALTVTQGPGDGVAVTLDNMKAMTSRDRGERDLTSSRCVFAQGYRQLRDTDPKLLRTVWDGERVFQINFVGEDGVDAGGVFREGMSRMVEDLFSPHLDLLLPCPNKQQATGQNNEKYVPNPQHSTPLALSMLRFVGRLMGLSLRTRLCLPFELPGMIWKRMLGLRVSFEDLRLVDTIICQFITTIKTCDDDGLTSAEQFREKYGEQLFFTCTGSDGVERELAPGGAARRVTFHNRLTFCRMVEHARTHEFDSQAAAMAEGLSDIVPMKVLRLFTAAELEIAVAGEPQFDIEFWKEHTDYKGYRSEDPTVDLFWKVIESMSAEDQSGFVRFAWGRSRLPPKAFWRVNMKLQRRNTSEENLPVSHTCFFSVELPPYTTEERMRKGLLTAIHFGMGGILNA